MKPKSVKTEKPGGLAADIDVSGKLDARLQPWLLARLAGLNNGVRRESAECIIAIFNITTQGVLSLHKQQYLLQQVTTMAHTYGKSFVAIVVMANRAGDMRGSTTVKSLAYSVTFVRFSNYPSPQCSILCFAHTFTLSHQLV